MSSAQPTSVEISPADVVRVESAHGGRGADGGGGGGSTGTGRATTEGASSSCGGAVAGGTLAAGADVDGARTVVDVSFPGRSSPMSSSSGVGVSHGDVTAVVLVALVRIGIAPVDSTDDVAPDAPTKIAATTEPATKAHAPMINRRVEEPDASVTTCATRSSGCGASKPPGDAPTGASGRSSEGSGTPPG